MITVETELHINPGNPNKFEPVKLSELKKFEIDPFSDNILNVPEGSNIELIVQISTDPHPVVLALFASIVSIIETIFEPSKKDGKKIIITFLDWGNVLTDVRELNFHVEYKHLILDREIESYQHIIKIRELEFQSLIQNVFYNVAWKNKKISGAFK